MPQYLLDTDSVKYVFQAHPIMKRRIVSMRVGTMAISAITYGLLMQELDVSHGDPKKQLHRQIDGFLARVEVLAWDQAAADIYSKMAEVKLSWVQKLVASHALSLGAVLVTDDKLFKKVRNLRIENWII